MDPAGLPLVGSDTAFAHRFGSSVSVDGDTAVVGQDGGAVTTGRAFVFIRSSGVWTQQGLPLVGSDTAFAHRFGSSVSVDGDTAVVGAPFATGQGAAYVFTRSGGVWTEQQKLDPFSPGFFPFANFGYSVSVDGDTVVVGANGEGAGTA